MPMPHRTFAEVATRRLVGKEGSERVATIRALLGELDSTHARDCEVDAVVAVSVLDDASLDRLREAFWSLTGLIRVWPRRAGVADEEPFALAAGATVADLADLVHHELGAVCAGGRIWGPSARFDGQRVGRAHVLEAGDEVEVLTR